jgi:dTDP-4-dehydrorhamnose 3,5-epimerase-like enzyme
MVAQLYPMLYFYGFKREYLMSVSYEKLAIITDQRGFVFELLSPEDFVYQRNAHMVLSLPGVVRGNHYHIKGKEIIIVLGPSLVRFREDGEIKDVVIPEKEAWRFVFNPGISHAIKNLSKDVNILAAFNTLEHDPENPDTKADTLI